MPFRITRASNFPANHEWWVAAAKDKAAPPGLRALLDGKTTEVVVTDDDVDDGKEDFTHIAAVLADWAATLPKWEVREDGRGGACRPLVFEVIA